MRGLLLVSAVTIGLAALASPETPPPYLPPALAANASVQSFKLISGETVCSIRRSVADVTGVANITLDSKCRSALPLLASADSWRDNADGSISLLGAQGRSLIEFAPADGEGYESFGQGAPLASLQHAN